MSEPSQPQPDETQPSPTARRPKPTRSSRISVERIETTPMTDDQYRRAVQALATLINQWRDRPTDEKEPPKSE
ncbi:hypothetical protein [Nocardia wallacei]|uniref:hypothetical protein n=1 Tax=Nocardia wallacei TaxID=480035 RepID=UPI002453BD55|nr:hypothetical protein [Nocardia wallacei]